MGSIDLSQYRPNEGQVKINNGNGNRPRWDQSNLATAPLNDTWQTVLYDFPLGLSSAPTTQWPQNISAPSDADIYDLANGTFIENTVPGQAHLWRVIFNYSKNNNNVRIRCQLENTLSGFLLEESRIVPGAIPAATFSFSFITIADSASLPAPFGTGQGYRIRIQADSNVFQNTASAFMEIDSVTRVSYQHGLR